jgi:hypothetical protein
MVISERSCGKTSQTTGPIDMLQQSVAVALAAALVAPYCLRVGSKAVDGGGVMRGIATPFIPVLAQRAGIRRYGAKA